MNPSPGISPRVEAEPKVFQNETALWTRFGRCITLITFLVPAYAFAVAAAVVNSFGKTDFSHAFSYESEKFFLKYIAHNAQHLSNAPLPRLTDAVNLPKKEVISRGDDISAIVAMRDQFIQKYRNTPLVEKFFNNFAQMKKVKGAHVREGICWGATLSFIKQSLWAEIRSEDELIQFAKKFEQGFDADAVAVQEILHKAMPGYKKLAASKPFSKNELTHKLQGVSEAEKAGKIDELIRTKMLVNWLRRYSDTAELLGLKMQDLDNPAQTMDHGYFDCSFLAQKQFEELSVGAYALVFGVRSLPHGINSHAVAYLKFSFGSYFLDPRYGLMRATPPYQAACKLAACYNTEGYETCRLMRFKPG